MRGAAWRQEWMAISANRSGRKSSRRSWRGTLPAGEESRIHVELLFPASDAGKSIQGIGHGVAGALRTRGEGIDPGGLPGRSGGADTEANCGEKEKAKPARLRLAACGKSLFFRGPGLQPRRNAFGMNG